jgi:GTPase-activating protein BEM2
LARDLLGEGENNVSPSTATPAPISTNANSANAASSVVASLAPFFGTDDNPHWLTKLLLVQILGADTSSGSLATSNLPTSHSLHHTADATPAGAGPNATSRTHSRSEVITSWARIGELCRTSGDEVSWRAIVAALCSPPVVRLEKVWRRVSADARGYVEAWVNNIAGHGGGNLRSGGVREPVVTPWGGNLVATIREQLGKARYAPSESPPSASGSILDETFNLEALEKVRVMFEGFRTRFLLCPRKVVLGDEDTTEDVRKLFVYWRDMYECGGSQGGGLGAKFQR